MANMLSDSSSDDGYGDESADYDDALYLGGDIEPNLYVDDEGFDIPPEYE